MMRYTGFPYYVPGVPARDLTRVEWEALSEDQRSNAARFYTEVDSVLSDSGAILSADVDNALSVDS